MIVNIHEAKTHLSRLLLTVAGGEEVIIARAGKQVARLVPCETPKSKRIAGRSRGKIVVPDDFNDPLPEDILKEFQS